MRPNLTATTDIYTLSLHDALPISYSWQTGLRRCIVTCVKSWPLETAICGARPHHRIVARSEEHTSELQSRRELVCRLLLEKKKTLAGSTSQRLRTNRCKATTQSD